MLHLHLIGWESDASFLDQLPMETIEISETFRYSVKNCFKTIRQSIHYLVAQFIFCFVQNLPYWSLVFLANKFSILRNYTSHFLVHTRFVTSCGIFSVFSILMQFCFSRQPRVHKFSVRTFTTPTKCSQCTSLMIGLVRQGSICEGEVLWFKLVCADFRKKATLYFMPNIVIANS